MKPQLDPPGNDVGTPPPASASDSDRLAEIKARADAAIPGPWGIDYDTCDCGDGYPCSHGTFVHAVTLSVSWGTPKHHEGGFALLDALKDDQ
jgi:hypothetical protein